ATAAADRTPRGRGRARPRRWRARARSRSDHPRVDRAVDRGRGPPRDQALWPPVPRCCYSTGASVLIFMLFGVAAGALTGVPIGPANVAVIDAAYRHTLRRAIAVGLGAACADGLYAALGVLGVTPVLRTYPSVPPILYAVSGVVLLIYGFLTARSQPVTPAQNDAPKDAEPSREMWSGFTLGLSAG